jgi:regulator of sigma E protease
MGTVFGSIWWFVVTLGVLVTFHEFGHYWVARRCGVRVLRFSVGFGRALWSRTARDGTQYQVAAIPLGGYVKMLDGRELDRALTPEEARVAFDRQHVVKRIAIVLAGPVANLVLCVSLLWVALQVGLPELAPQLGRTSGAAAAAGLRDGDRILAIDGETTGSWDEAGPLLALAAIDHRTARVQVRDGDGQLRSVSLDLAGLPRDFDQTDPFTAIGVQPATAQDRPIIGFVAPEGAAADTLRVGDEILAIDGAPIAYFHDIPTRLQAVAAEGKPLRIDLRREGEPLTVAIAARRSGEDKSWKLGIASRQMATVARYAPGAAVVEALRRTRGMASSTFALLGRLVTGKASTRNVSGVVGIAQMANAEAGVGLGRLLAFMASLSLALCIMNLLPIPVLDGGHLLYYLIELATGRPLSERLLVAGQYLGLALLAGLITLAFYNDIHRLVS